MLKDTLFLRLLRPDKIGTRNDKTLNMEKIWIVIGILIACIFGYLMIKQKPIMWLIGIAIAFGPLLFIYHKMTLVILLVSIFTVKGIFGEILGILPRQIIWFTDVIILLLFGKVLLLKGLKNKISLNIPILLFLIWAVLSGHVNSIPLLTIFVQLKDFFRYILLFYILYNLELDEKFLKGFIGLFIGIILIQILITIGQFQIYGYSDWTGGSLGRHGTAEMVILIVGTIALLVGLFIYYRPNLLYLIASAGLLVPPILGGARAGLFFLPATFIFLSRNFLKEKTPKFIGAILLFIIISFGTIYVSPTLREGFSGLVTTSELGFKEQVYMPRILGTNVPGRLRAPRIALQWLRKNKLAPIFGYGFGITKESFFEDFTGKFFEKYSPRTNQLSSTLLEMGFPGLIFYFWAIFLIFKTNRKFFRQNKSGYWKAVSFGLDGMIFMHVVAIIYTNIWRTHYSPLPFWLFAGIIYNIAKQKEIGDSG